MEFLLKVGIFLVCPVLVLLQPTYHQLNINGNSYCLSKENTHTNSEGKRHCTKIEAELAMFDDNAEYLKVFEAMAQNSTLAKETWISINYTIANGEHSFYWTKEMFNKSLWSSGNPDGNCKYGSNQECCVRLLFSSRGLADYDCTQSFAFLCKVNNRCGFGVKKCDVTCANSTLVLECLDGYFHNKTDNTCRDTDECKTNASQCEQTCNNSVGSFMCGCFEGYTLNSDNRTCADINECSSYYKTCQQNCTNSIGSFHCSCFNGFTLKEDNRTCADIDECLNGSSVCQQNCTNTNGSFNCSCFEGFTLNSDNRTCADINECLSEHKPCQQNCTNTNGYFNCSCSDGFTLKEDNRTCVDINECLNGSSSCQQRCNNTIGSFHCSCEIGHTLSENGVDCIKLDECLVSRCERLCQNGSDSCLVDCLQTSQLCEHDCVKHTGTYECTCRPGYSLNTTSETACHDIDECSLNSSLCEVYCNNTPGSYYCSCPQGFHLSEDRYSCVKFTPHNYCPCSCSFNAKKRLVSKEQMTSYLMKLRKSLEVDKSNLLSTRLLVESQTDERPSSKAIGYVGLVFVSILFGLLILPDCISMASAVRNKIISYSRKTNIV